MTRNAQDIIDDMRNIVKPRIAKMLLEANFEGCGKEDKAEFETEFEMTLTLAEKALEQEPRWIPMVRREPTDEEKAEYLAQYGEELCYMLENEMPLNGQEVLVSVGELVSEDVFDEDFYNFENNDIENVDAWMPKPKPYKAESEEER